MASPEEKGSIAAVVLAAGFSGLLRTALARM